LTTESFSSDGSCVLSALSPCIFTIPYFLAPTKLILTNFKVSLLYRNWVFHLTNCIFLWGWSYISLFLAQKLATDRICWICLNWMLIHSTLEKAKNYALVFYVLKFTHIIKSLLIFLISYRIILVLLTSTYR
jgi:hypothetical protein